MKFRYIQMERFKRFKVQKRIEFIDGINVIYGENETGKSTTLLALETALFTSATSKKGEELISWGVDMPWTIELCGEIDNGEFKIQRDLSSKSEYIELPNGERYSNKSKILEKVGDILSFTDPSVLSSTILIRQGEIFDINRTGISNRLKAVISGTEIDIDDIIERARILTTSVDKNIKGPKLIIKNKNDELNELYRRKADIEKLEGNIKDKRIKLIESKYKLEKINKELEIKNDIYKKNSKLLDMEKEKRDIENKWKQYQEYQKIKDELENRRKEKERKPIIKQEDFNLINEKNILLTHTRPGSEKATRSLRYFFIGAGIVSVATGLILGVIRGFGVLEVVLNIIGGGIIVGGILTFLIRERALDREGIKKEINEILQNYKIDSIDKFVRIFNENAIIEKDIESLETVLSAIRGGLSPDEYESNIIGIDIRYITLEKEIKDHEKYRIPPDEISKLEREIKDLEKEKNRIDGNIRGDESYLKDIDMNIEELMDIIEKIKDCENLIKQKEYEIKIYDVVNKLLSEANIEVSREIIPKIEEEVEKYISIITENRYSDVKIDETTLSISVNVEPINEFKNTDELSYATAEQFYFVARVAIGDHLTMDKKLPLLLDDPFVHYDNVRFNKTMDIIKEMSKERQIIIFTCSNRYNNWADNIIELQ
ncbi:MAG: ATP-binding protein [bacterium]